MRLYCSKECVINETSLFDSSKFGSENYRQRSTQQKSWLQACASVAPSKPCFHRFKWFILCVDVLIFSSFTAIVPSRAQIWKQASGSAKLRFYKN